MRLIQLFICALTLLSTTTVFSADFTGNWCREQGNGKPVDLITVGARGEVFPVSLSEGWGAPKYSQGVASQAGNKLFATLKAVSSGNAIHAVMTISGNQLEYRSFKDNQTNHYWKGDYKRCSK